MRAPSVSGSRPGCSLRGGPTRISLAPVLASRPGGPRRSHAGPPRPSTAGRGAPATREPHRDPGPPSTVEPVTTVLVTAMVLVAVMFVVILATHALAARAHRRRQLDDARAEARHWVERLGGELLVLDGAAAGLGTG